MADEKKIVKELSGIKSFLLNSVSVMMTEAQKQTETLLSIKEYMASGAKLAGGETDKAGMSAKAAGGKGPGIAGWLKEIKEFASVMPKFFKAIMDIEDVPTDKFTDFLTNMIKAITNEGEYGTPEEISELYKAVGKTFKDLGDSIGKFSKGLLLFAVVSKLKITDTFIKFIDKFFAKERMDKIDPKTALEAARALGVMGISIFKFASLLALSTPFLLLGIPALLIGLPIFLAVFGFFGAMKRFLLPALIGTFAMVQFGKALLLFSLSLFVMRFLTAADVMRGLLAISVFTVFVGLMILMQKIGGARGVIGGTTALIAFSAALGIMAISMLLFKLVDWPDIIKAGVVLFALTGAVMLLGIMKKKSIAGASILIAMAASVFIMGLSIMLFRNIEYDEMLKPAVVLAGLTVIIMRLGSNAKKSAVGVLSILAMVAALWILSKIIPLYAALDWVDIGKAAAVLVGLGTAMFLVGTFKTQILWGTGAMMAATILLFLIAKAVKNFAESGVTWEILGMMGATVGGLGIAMAIAGIGSIPVYIAFGSAAMLIASAALWVLSKAMVNFGKAGLTWELIGIVGATVGMIGVEMAGFGFLSPFILAGGVAMLAAGAALISIGKGLQEFVKLDVDIKSLTDSDSGKIPLLLSAVSSVFADIGLKQKIGGGFLGIGGSNPVAIGIRSVRGMGTVLTDIAEGVQAFADLTFVDETGKRVTIPDGWLTPTGKIPVAIQSVIGVVGDVFATLGETNGETGWFSKGKIGKGVDAINGAGTELVNIAKAVQEFANLTFIDEHGKRVPIDDDMLGPDGTVNKNIVSIITSLSTALGTIGEKPESKNKKYGWFGTTATDRGKEVIQGLGEDLLGITDSAKNVVEIIKSGIEPKEIETTIESLIVSLSKSYLSAAKIGEKADTVKENMKVLSKASDNMKGIVDNTTESYEALKKYPKIVEMLPLYYTSIGDAFTAIFKSSKVPTAKSIKYYNIVARGIVGMAEKHADLARVASSMDKISNSLIKTFEAIDNIADNKLERVETLFSTLIEIDKMNDATFEKKLVNYRKVLEAAEKAGDKLPTAGALPATEKTKKEGDKTIQLEENMVGMMSSLGRMEEYLSRIAGAIEGTLVVDVAADDINSLIAGTTQ